MNEWGYSEGVGQISVVLSGFNDTKFPDVFAQHLLQLIETLD